MLILCLWEGRETPNQLKLSGLNTIDCCENLTKWILGNVIKMLAVAGTSSWICGHSPGIERKDLHWNEFVNFGSRRIAESLTWCSRRRMAPVASIECSPFFEFGAAGCGCFRYGCSALRFLLIWKLTNNPGYIIGQSHGFLSSKAEMLHLDDTYRAILIQLWEEFFPAVLSQPEKWKATCINKLVKILFAFIF